MSDLLITINVPILGKKFDIIVSSNKKVISLKKLLIKGINNLENESVISEDNVHIYSKSTGNFLNSNLTLYENNIASGEELILI